MDDIEATREIAVRLVRAANAVKADFADAVAPLGLSVPSARALLLLDEPMPMRVLSDRLTCDQSYITRIADELEERGLITRAPGEDRRVQILKLTRTGTRMRRTVFAAVSETNRVALRLDASDRAELDALLVRLLG
ncbi:MAG: MarR family winged helix-turn-helix transcriptional regulator [Gaiellales bacterium]